MIKLFSARARCVRQFQTLGRIGALLRQGRAQAHGEELRLLARLYLALWTHVAPVARRAVLTALWLPKPSARDALPRTVQCRPTGRQCRLRPHQILVLLLR